MKKSYHKLILLFSIPVIFVSCAKEDQQGPTADVRDRFVAAWNCNENSSQTGANPAFTVNIIKSSNSTQVLLGNFYGLGASKQAYANISGDSLFLPAQTYEGNTVQGKGALQGSSVLKLNYTVDDGSNIDIVSATLTK